MKPTLRLDTGRDTFFTAPYVKVTPLPTPIPGDNLEDGYSFKTDRSRFQRAKRWFNGKARGGRRLVVLGLFGILWFCLYFYKQHVCPSSMISCSRLGACLKTRLSYIQRSTGIGCSWASRYRRFVQCFTTRSYSKETVGCMAEFSRWKGRYTRRSGTWAIRSMESRGTSTKPTQLTASNAVQR
jgi:hypothetical protein